MTQPLHFVPTLPAEEAARANLYGLMARLFYAPPDSALLERLAASRAPEQQGELAQAWDALAAAASEADAESVRAEYDETFVGTGKSPITLYVSAYLVRYSNEAPLVDLRAHLAALRIARRNEASEPEDHLALVCDAMRYLIVERNASLAEQKQFFERWIGSAAEALCDAISHHDTTRFYRAVAQVFGALCRIEHTSFEML